ncbi:MAG TPA: hypothetical protein VH298_11895 [Jatrophihabitans sp.]|nr:hypothetical protein [Jatrophihabitans sp.]
MLILFAFALLILAVAVGMLFAMCAELASRSGGVASAEAEPVRYVRPLGRSSVYLRDSAAWPTELAGPRANDDFLLVVLSTSCATCNTIGEQLSNQDWAERSEGRLGVVVSTADREIAEEFIAKYRLNRLPCYLDVHGDWSAAALGLSVSPAGLIFHHGDLDETYVFNHIEPLWTTFTEASEWKEQPHHDESLLTASPAEASSAPSGQVV